MHGVFLKIFSSGVLITGDSGSGKSETALSLLDRGHALISDDLVTFTKIPRNTQSTLPNNKGLDSRLRGNDTHDTLIGSCPSEKLHGYLHHRDLGLLNIRTLFGKKAVANSYPLTLVVELFPPPHASYTTSCNTCTILGIDIAYLQLHNPAHYNTALFIELAVKKLNLQLQKNMDNNAP